MGSQPIGAIRAERVTLKCPDNRPIKLRDRAYSHAIWLIGRLSL